MLELCLHSSYSQLLAYALVGLPQGQVSLDKAPGNPLHWERTSGSHPGTLAQWQWTSGHSELKSLDNGVVVGTPGKVKLQWWLYFPQLGALTEGTSLL